MNTTQSIFLGLVLVLVLSVESCKPKQKTIDKQEVEVFVESKEQEIVEGNPSQLWKKRAEEGMLIHVYGTEPFWSLSVYADSMLFTTPDFRWPLVLLGDFDVPSIDHLILKGTHEGGEAILVLLEEGCSDQMSDVVNHYTAQLDLNDFVSGTTMQLMGCGNFVIQKQP
jgi:uncharacterized membrane protein